MNPVYRKSIFVFTSFVALLLLACNATFTVGFPTPTIAPPTVTATSTPPSLKLMLTSIPYSENNLNPPSTITAQIPQLAGNDDPRILAFNQTMNDLVHSQVDTFKAGLIGLPTPPQVTNSTFDEKYTVVYQGGDIWSVLFDLAVYVDGAAHPGDMVQTINYDFEHSKIIELDDLFLSGSNYLDILAEYSAKELSTRDIGFNETTLGAEPTRENYRNWNITPQGLMITFERGQVAAYAAPAQVVIVPYDQLKDVIDPEGVLSNE
jgi:Protein of unknown function (DUF3298)